MYDNYHYPWGADNASAPWNENGNPRKEFGLDVFECMSKHVNVVTDDYNLEIEFDDDGDGGKMVDVAYTDDTDWAKVFSDNDNLTLPRLLDGIMEYLKRRNEYFAGLAYCRALTKEENNELNEVRHLLRQCSGWVEEEIEYCKED